MRTTSNIIKSLVDSFTSFHKVFHVVFIAPVLPQTSRTQCRLIRTFIHAWRSLRQRSCWHACHKMKMVKQDSMNIYNRGSCWLPSFKTWLCTLNQRKLNKKDTKKVDFFRNRRSNIIVNENAWQSLLFCFSRQHASKNTQCKCQDCQAFVKHAIILLPFAMWPSTLLPNHVRNNIRLVFIALLLWLRAMRKSHLRVSATFLLACLPPIGNSWKIFACPSATFAISFTEQQNRRNATNRLITLIKSFMTLERRSTYTNSSDSEKTELTENDLENKAKYGNDTKTKTQHLPLNILSCDLKHLTTDNLTKIHYLLRLDTGKPCLKVFAETQEWRLQVSCPEKLKQENKGHRMRSVECKPRQTSSNHFWFFH